MRTLVLGTAGHIDHGKSALVEALTGVHPDRLKEEQARGITIELGFGHTRIGDVRVALVDVPGHERFVRTMLAGAGGLDAVLLIIAADESVMPQTREHLDICRLLGIRRGLIVITKCDLVDRDTLDLARLEARELVAGTPLADAPLLETSARTGAGMDGLRAAIAALAEGGGDARVGAARVPIDRAFSVKGFGTVVTGTLVSGSLAVEDAVMLLPAGRPARVRGLHVHGSAVSTATAPSRIAVNLGGVDLADVRRGMTVAPEGALQVTQRLDVWFELLPGSPPLRHGARVRVHQGTSDAAARVSLSAIRATPDGTWVPVAPGATAVVVPAGGTAFARLQLLTPMVMTRGDRFVLRSPAPARTIGGGRVIDPVPPRVGVRTSGAAARAQHLDGAPVDVVVRTWIEEAGLPGVTSADLARRAGVASSDIERLLSALQDAGAIALCGTHSVSVTTLTRAAADVTAQLTAFHREHPGEGGMPREVVRGRAARGAAPATFQNILARAGVADAERLSLSSHRPAVSSGDVQLRAALLDGLRQGGLQPPDPAAIVAGTPPAVLQRVLVALGKERGAVKLGDLWFHAEVLAGLRDRVRALGSGTTVDVAAAKAHFGVSRKYAIPLLEHLDRERITRRVGDKRVVL